MVRVLRAYLKSNLRGRTRLTGFLARHSAALHAVPIEFVNGPAVYMDLRTPGAHGWLRGSPWSESPRERDVQYVMRRVVRRGDVACDIGANLGLHTALLSSLVGPAGEVHAFEPNPGLHRLLERTVQGAGNCRLHPVALSDVGDDATLFVPDDHSMASLADWTEGRRGPTRPVACRQVRLDDLISTGLPKPDFIKCDVEGAELKVFRGASETLDRSSAPIILFEAGRNTTRGFGLTKWSALEYLEGLDKARFTFFEIDSAGQLKDVDRAAGGSLNILAVPAARIDRLTTAP